MKLDWAMLANHSETQNGLGYISGAGIDTINAQALPAAFFGSVVLRIALHPMEIEREHAMDIRIIADDGNELARLQGNIPPQPRREDMPVGWNYTAIVSMNVAGLRLDREGFYSVEILADGQHLSSLPFRVKLVQ